MAEPIRFKVGNQEISIDFSKLQAGVKAEDLQGVNHSIFENFAGADGVLDSMDIKKLEDKVRQLAKDAELSKSEAADLEIDGKRIGRNTNNGKIGADALFNFLKGLAGKVDTSIKTITRGELEETVEYENGKKVTTKNEEDGVIITTLEDKVETVVHKNADDEVVKQTVTTYDDEGHVVKTEVTENGVTTITEGNKVTVKEGDEVKKETVTEDNVVTVKEGGKTTVTTKDDAGNVAKTVVTEGNTETTTEGDKVTVVTKDTEGNPVKTAVTENGVTTVTEGSKVTVLNAENRPMSQTVGGKTVEYDGNGNTKVIVQLGESMSKLAKKYGCTVKDLIDLNGKESLIYVKLPNGKKVPAFKAGQEILVPNEIAPDDDKIKNNKSRKEALKEANEYFKKKAEEEAARQQQTPPADPTGGTTPADPTGGATPADPTGGTTPTDPTGGNNQAGGGTAVKPAVPASIDPTAPLMVDQTPPEEVDSTMPEEVDSTPPEAEKPLPKPAGAMDLPKDEDVKEIVDAIEDNLDAIYTRESKTDEVFSKVTPENIAYVVDAYPISEDDANGSNVRELINDIADVKWSDGDKDLEKIQKLIIEPLKQRAEDLGISYTDYDTAGKTVDDIVSFVEDLASRIREFDKNVGFRMRGKVDFDKLQDEKNSNGVMTRDVTRNDETGEISFYMEYEYDAEGNCTRSVNRDANGKIESYTEYEYDENGNWTRNVYRDANGKIESYTEYEYDENGNMTRLVHRDANGKLSEGSLYTEYEYDTEGNKTREIDYDSDGQLYCYANYDADGNETLMVYRYEDCYHVYETDAEGRQWYTKYSLDDELLEGPVESYR